MTTPREQAKPLTARQKAVLCQMSTRAWNALGTMLGIYDATEWRHATVFDVTGKDGLTLCDQLDYIPIYNHYATMLGMPLRADRTPRTALERALGVLRDALARWELPESYAAAIMRDRLGPLGTGRMPLSHMAAQLGPEGVRQVTYTIITRGRQRVARMAAAGGWDMPAEPHASATTLPPGGLQSHFGAVLTTPTPTSCASSAREEVEHA